MKIRNIDNLRPDAMNKKEIKKIYELACTEYHSYTRVNDSYMQEVKKQVKQFAKENRCRYALYIIGEYPPDQYITFYKADGSIEHICWKPEEFCESKFQFDKILIVNRENDEDAIELAKELIENITIYDENDEETVSGYEKSLS